MNSGEDVSVRANIAYSDFEINIRLIFTLHWEERKLSKQIQSNLHSYPTRRQRVEFAYTF